MPPGGGMRKGGKVDKKAGKRARLAENLKK
jgi:hypothetical protein